MKRFLTVTLSFMLIAVSNFTSFGAAAVEQQEQINDFDLMETQIKIILEAKDSDYGKLYNFKDVDFAGEYLKYFCAIHMKNDAKEYDGMNGSFVKLSENDVNSIIDNLLIDADVDLENIAQKVDGNYYVNINGISDNYEVAYKEGSGSATDREYTFEYTDKIGKTSGSVTAGVDKVNNEYVISSIINIEENNSKAATTAAEETDVQASALSASNDWEFTSLSITNKDTSKNKFDLDDVVIIKPNITGDTSALEYRFEWSYNNGQLSGVTKDYSSSSGASFRLTRLGVYTFTARVRQGNKVVTKTGNVTVGPSALSAGDWNLTGVSVTSQSKYSTGDVITISPKTTGNTSGVEYKYVWSHENWSTWGVTSNFTTKNTASFKLTKPGKYEFFIDAKYGNKVVTKSVVVNVSSNWSHNGGKITTAAPHRLGETVKISALTSGSDYGAQYKFVYEYNNWETWGVIKPFSSSHSISFVPPKAGKCNIYIDITVRGLTRTRTVEMNVLERWYHYGVDVAENPIYKLNSPVTISANAQGLTSDLQYKFVYSKNNWEDWGVIKPFSTSSKISFTPKTEGVYDLIVDIKDSRGRIESMSKQIIVSDKGWVISDYSFSKPSPITEGTSTVITYNVKGYNLSGIKYKFVAHNKTTDDWYILQPLAASNSYNWTPAKPGVYNIYMEAQDVNGNWGQKIVSYNVEAKINSSVKVNLSNSSATIPQGKSFYLKKNSVSPASASIKFVSNNTNIATVDANKGYVYAKNNGKTQILAVDSQGKTAGICEITVTDSEPIRFAYSSPNSAPKGSTITMYAITDKTRTAARFNVNGKTVNATKKVEDGNTYIWSGTITMNTAGEYSVTAYSQKNGSWTTCSNGNATIYVTNSANATTTTSERRRTSDKGINFIAESEGFSSAVYDDLGGTPTLGYGKVIYGGDQFYNNLTKTEGYAMLVELVNNGSYSKYVNDFLVSNSLKFNQHQFDALVSFSYNVGASWTLAMYKREIRAIILASGNKDLNNIDKQKFATEFNTWHHMSANNKCVKGLMDRRINELEIFFYNDYVRRMPPPKTSQNEWFYHSITDCPNYK